MQRRLGPSYYDILGVSPAAETAVIDQAYRQRVREVRDQPGGGDLTRQLNLAYKALKNPEKRASYDASLAGVRLPRSDRARASAAFLAPGPAPLPPLGKQAGEPLVEAEVSRPVPSPAPKDPGNPAALEMDTPLPPAVPAAARSLASEPTAAEPEPGQTETFETPVSAEPAADEPIESSAAFAGSPIEREPALDPVPTAAVIEREPYDELVSEDGRERGGNEEPPFVHEDDEIRSRRRRSKAPLALVAAVFLALLGTWLFVRPSGLRDGTVQIAARSPEPSSPVAAGRLEPDTGAAEAEGPAPAEPPPTAEPASEEDSVTTAAPAPRAEQSRQLDEAVAVALQRAAQVGRAEGGQPGRESEQDASEPAPRESVTTAAAAPIPVPPRVVPRENRATPARHIGGGLVNADNPGGQFVGSVGVRFTVLPSGRTTRCRVTRSSGSAALDARTCGLLQQRLQFTPALDADGRPVAVEVGSTYTWGRTRRPR